MLLWRHFRLPKLSQFCQFIPNAFFGKFRLQQGKIIFCLNVIKKNNSKGGAYIPLLPMEKGVNGPISLSD